MTKVENLSKWIAHAKELGATHLLIAREITEYPIYVMPSDSLKNICEQHKNLIVQIYSLDKDILRQLDQCRTNSWCPLKKYYGLRESL